MTKSSMATQSTTKSSAVVLADALPEWHKVGNRILLTSRDYGLDEASLHRLGLPRARLEPLPEALQDLFVARWFHRLGKPEKTPELIETIRGRHDLAPFVENPMHLKALCVLYDGGRRLPEDRYDLYSKLVEKMLNSRFPGTDEQARVQGRLEAVALGMHTGEKNVRRQAPAFEISYDETERLLRKFAGVDASSEQGRVKPVEWREELLTRSGLLLPQGEKRVAFDHPTFQEFLAAERVRWTHDDLEPVFRERGAVAEWRPTLLFLFAAQIANKDAQWGFGLLDRLTREQDRATVKANPAPAHFIAEALDLWLAKNYAVPEPLKETLRRLCLDAIEDEIGLQARQALGLCLGRLGDPRIFDLRDPCAYVEVPAGNYAYNEKERTVAIAAPFWIGRYPVTNSQYQAFIEENGYRERKWWSDAGWVWLQGDHTGWTRLQGGVVIEPEYWQDRRWNGPNQPVMGVSFWEAEAFSRWAGGRLPRVEEREVAARGLHGCQYPWGNEWEDGICNSSEAGLGVTSPVGLFPHARQAELGIEDLAGNVWEWCDSFARASDVGKNENAPRWLCGGSYLHDLKFAPSSVRIGLSPPGRLGSIGFRVVRSSS